MDFLATITANQEFATLPAVAERLLQLLESPDPDLREVGRIIENDPTLTLKIIRVANSPMFGMRSETASIQQAIMTLGLSRTANIVLGVVLFSRLIATFQSGTTDLMQKFWRHSACTAVVAKTLSAKLGLDFKEYEFLGGLLHDIGKLAMIQFQPGLYRGAVAMAGRENISDAEAERKTFGLDHYETGKIISRNWKLPSELQCIIEFHGQPEALDQHRELTAIVRLSDILCEMWGAGLDEGIFTVDIASQPSWLLLCAKYPAFNSLDLEKFTFELEDDFTKGSQFLQALTH